MTTGMLNLAVEVLVMQGDDDCWERVCQEFSSPRLPPFIRFEAIDGSELTPGEIQSLLTPRAAYELTVARRYPWGWVHEGIPTSGAVGCYLSHVELWKRAASRTIPTLILEQDAQPSVSLDGLLERLESLPRDADLALIGHLKAIRPFSIDLSSRKSAWGFHQLHPLQDVFGTHAYIVTPGGAQKLADRSLPINTQLDGFIRILSATDSGVNIVYHLPSLVQQRTGFISAVQPAGTAWNNFRLGSSLLIRAMLGGLFRTACRPWYFLRARFGKRPVRHGRSREGDST